MYWRESHNTLPLSHIRSWLNLLSVWISGLLSCHKNMLSLPLIPKHFYFQNNEYLIVLTSHPLLPCIVPFNYESMFSHGFICSEHFILIRSCNTVAFCAWLLSLSMVKSSMFICTNACIRTLLFLCHTSSSIHN